MLTSLLEVSCVPMSTGAPTGKPKSTTREPWVSKPRQAQLKGKPKAQLRTPPADFFSPRIPTHGFPLRRSEILTRRPGRNGVWACFCGWAVLSGTGGAQLGWLVLASLYMVVVGKHFTSFLIVV